MKRDTSSKVVHIRIEPGTHRRVLDIAKKDRRTAAYVIRELIAEGLSYRTAKRAEALNG